MMSDNQRRLICRLLFLVTCVVPTSMVAYRICHPQTSGQWQQMIQAQLGVGTSVESIETPGPYVTILRGLKFTDPDIGTIMDAMEVRVIFGETNRIEIPHSVRLTNAGIIQLVETINEHLIRAHAADRPWRIHFLDQTVIEESIHSAETGSHFPETLVAENLQIDVVPLVDGTMTQLHFQISGGDPEKWIVCALSRSFSDANQISQQRVELNTDKQVLPCWLLGELVPEVSKLGPKCDFAGQLRFDFDSKTHQPSGLVTGQFTQIDPALAPYPAQVELCNIEGGNLEKLDAYLVLPDGSFSRIQATLEVVEQFNIVRAIRTAALSNEVHQAETNYR